MLKIAMTAVLGALIAAAAQAEIVTVEATGQVVFNGVTTAPLSAVTVGQQAKMSFTVDSNVFVDGIPGDLRSYEIDQASFALGFSGGVTVGLLNPFPAGQTPYFTLMDGFPVSDGFFVSSSTVSPGGVPISQTPIQANLDLGYVGTTLSSLDIVAAAGVYNFTGLTRFSFTLWRVFPDNAVMEMEFQQLSIVAGVVGVEDASWGSVKALFQ